MADFIPVDAIGNVLSFLCGKTSCDNFLIVCCQVYNQNEVFGRIRSIEYDLGCYGLRHAPLETWNLFLEISTAKFEIWQIQLYIARGLPIKKLFGGTAAHRFICTGSVSLMKFLLQTYPEMAARWRRKLVTAIKHTGALHDLISKGDVATLTFLTESSPVIVRYFKLQNCRLELFNCHSTEMYRFIFTYNETDTQEFKDFIELVLQRSHQTAFKFIVEELGYVCQEQDCYHLPQIHILKYLLDKCGIENPEKLAGRYLNHGMKTEYQYLCQRFQIQSKSLLSTVFNYYFAQNCDAEFLTHVRDRVRSQKDFDREMRRTVKLFDRHNGLENMDFEKFQKMWDLDYFDIFPFILEAGHMANRQICEFLYDKDAKFLPNIILGLTQSPYRQQANSLIYDFLLRDECVSRLFPIIVVGDKKIIDYVFENRTILADSAYTLIPDALQNGNEYAVRRLLQVDGIDKERLMSNIEGLYMDNISIQTFSLFIHVLRT